MKKILAHIPFIVFIIFYFSISSYKLVSNPTPFYDWDEGIYAQVGREMVRSKSFLVPLWQGNAWLDKPPLPSLVYGVVMLVPFQPEITTRIATLFLSCVALSFFYAIIVTNTNSKLLGLTSTIITAFLPLFSQRAQALNVDVFLLIGWFGYVLFFDRLMLSTVFLLIGVLSKSLLGFYPIGMIAIYDLYRFLIQKDLKKNHLFHNIRKYSIQIGISLLWFVGMTFVFKYEFIKYHFLESHLKRVTASIEQHFGQRTFYIDEIINQFKFLIIPALFSIGILVIQFFKSKKIENFFLLFFVPWFLFLNLTKTKTAWYLYPVVPQFALLALYPISLVRHTLTQVLLFTFALFLFFKFVSPFNAFITSTYSKPEEYQLLATQAKKNGCTSLSVLVNEQTRTSYETLKKMDLVISTTTWWGNHPSIAYYADVPTTYLYSVKEVVQNIQSSETTNACFSFGKNGSINCY